MFARVDVHWVNEGMMDKAQAQIANNTVSVKETGDAIARYILISESDPLKVTTVAIWKNKEAWEKWRAARYPQGGNRPATPPDAPKIWAKIEGDNYEASQEI